MTRIDRHRDLVSVRQLYYFVVLAEHGSISSAAKSLNISQPTLSETVAKLEKSLDLRLVIRTARGTHITQAGAQLAERGTKLLRDLDNIIDEVRVLSDEPRGPVNIGISSSLSNLLSVPLLETVHAEFPDIRLNFLEGMSDDILDWMETDRVDLGVIYYPKETSDLMFEDLLTEEVFLVTAPDNWEGEIGPDGVFREPIPAKKLADLPLVLTNTTQTARQMQEKFARSINIELDVIASINSLPRIIEMVCRASAYSLTAHGAVLDAVDEGKLALVRIVDPPFLRTAHLARNRARPYSRACMIVEERIKAITAELLDRRGIVSAQTGRWAQKAPHDTVSAG